MRLDPILNWALALTEPNEATANLPTCPYASKAFEDGRVSIIFKTAFGGAKDILRIIQAWSDYYDVVLLIVDRHAASVAETDAILARVHQPAGERDLRVMADHPERPFVVAGKSNSQGDYLIFFIQRRSRLQAASKALEKTGYYRNWPSEAEQG